MVPTKHSSGYHHNDIWGTPLRISPFSPLDPGAEPGELPHVFRPPRRGLAFSAQPFGLVWVEDRRMGKGDAGHTSWSGTLMAEGNCSRSVKRVAPKGKEPVQVQPGREWGDLGRFRL